MFRGFCQSYFNLPCVFILNVIESFRCFIDKVTKISIPNEHFFLGLVIFFLISNSLMTPFFYLICYFSMLLLKHNLLVFSTIFNLSIIFSKSTLSASRLTLPLPHILQQSSIVYSAYMVFGLAS